MLPGYRQKMYQKSLVVHVKMIPETVDNDCKIIISSWVSNMSIASVIWLRMEMSSCLLESFLLRITKRDSGRLKPIRG